jgi:uncharacterized protein involved in copper resistance
MYSSLRYKKQEKFAPYIPIAKARGFTALSRKKMREKVINRICGKVMERSQKN